MIYFSFCSRLGTVFFWMAVAAVCSTVSACKDGPATKEGVAVEVVVDEPAERVEIRIEGHLFTSYVFGDSTGMLKKPILYPIIASSGVSITRGFPLEVRPGERADHPHQVGSWMNHGDVNDLDFWNNSGARAPEDRWKYGAIVHREIVEATGGETGVLVVVADWIKPDGSILLGETTRFEFAEQDSVRIIDRKTTWMAGADSVRFEDSKEGMMAIRVARELEHLTDRADPFVLADGSLSEPRVDSTYATGRYLSSEGVEGAAVWGTRAEWVVLNGSIDGTPIAIGMIDHPDNVGFPAYWMARDYGLFAANPLGARVYSAGADPLDFTLSPGSSVTFRYRMVIQSDSTLARDTMSRVRDRFWSNQ